MKDFQYQSRSNNRSIFAEYLHDFACFILLLLLLLSLLLLLLLLLLFIIIIIIIITIIIIIIIIINIIIIIIIIIIFIIIIHIRIYTVFLLSIKSGDTCVFLESNHEMKPCTMKCFFVYS